jgi:hypothetical protein
MKKGIIFSGLGVLIGVCIVLAAAEAFAGLDTDTLVKIAINEANQEIGRRLLGSETSQDPLLAKILKGADIKLKIFESDDEDESSSLGFEYSYSKDIANYAFNPEKVEHSGFALNLAATGNVAFKQEVNPNDFLDTNISFVWFLSKGGVLPKQLDFALLNKLEDTAAEANTIQELNNLAEWKTLSETIRKNLSDQFYFDVSATGGLEADQTFDHKQYYYGLHAGILAKGWNSDKSFFARFNILDYPAALLRWISGVDKQWRPRGSAFPEFLIGVDHVDPNEETPRETLAGDDSSFERIRFEASFRTLAAAFNNADVFLEANYRYYQEINPSYRVEAEGLDVYSYFTIALVMPKANGLYVSYTTGKLPLDSKDDQVYELGFKYQF